MISTSLSGRDLSYRHLCSQAATDERVFRSFRRHEIYTGIVETVKQEKGNAYAEVVRHDAFAMSRMPRFKLNDMYGQPETHNYPDIGTISPTTLRYIKILCDLRAHFGSLDGMEICEIGCGYGGQCRIIDEAHNIKRYCLVDLSSVLMLAKRFLDNYILHSIVTYRTMNELERRPWDLVISNYAFSELPRNVQDMYLSKVIWNSQRGYMIYNGITPEEYRTHTPQELIDKISNARVLPEQPTTDPGNCLIVWNGANE